jgi:hypothetical protein
MKSSKIRTFSICLLIILTLCTGSSGRAIAFDTTPPKVESCIISPRQVSDVSGGNVRVTIKVVSKNGLSSNVLSVLNLKDNTSSATRQLGGFIMTRQSGDEFSGTWIQDIAVKPGLMPGIYELSIFPLTDKLQNGTFFLGCPGQDVSYGVAAPTPRPTPTPTPVASTTPKISDGEAVALAQNAEFKARLTQLESQLKKIQSALLKANQKLTKICSVKPKPKGC